MRFVALLLAAALGHADDRAAPLQRLLDSYHRAGEFDGAALVAVGGEIVYRGAFGAVTPDTRFRIGSITKQFTAALILQLAEAGKLRLDGVISDYLPNYPAAQGRRVTLHQLLNHTSGIPVYSDDPEVWGRLTRRRSSPAGLLKLFAERPLAFEPGSRFEYDNSGYVVLGAIVERVTGKSYGRALEERILAPLGMRDTGHEPAARPVPRLAAGHRRTLDGLVPASFMDMSSVFAAGSMYSTVDDLFRWEQALYSDRVLSAASRERMFDGGKFNYGYGWMWQAPLFAHEGSVYGFHSLIIREPRERILIVLLQNVEGEQWAGDIASGIFAVFSGMEPPPPRLPVSRLLRDVWKTGGIAETVRRYREWKVARAHEIDFRQPELKKLGDWLLQNAKDSHDAVEIFRLNTESHPESAEAQETLGDACLIVGDAPRAIAAFERALELDPANRTAASALRRLKAAKR